MELLQRLREVFRATKHKSPSRKYCPRCGSPNLKLSSSLDLWLTPVQYVCENCGYKGPVIMEKEERKARQF